jgi:FkbM family methyltransferase
MRGDAVEVETPGGNVAYFACRDDTSDRELVNAVVGRDEYRIGGRNLAGWAIDVGAHIGSVSIALALDYPGLLVVAVEPVPANRGLLRHNIAMNGLRRRVFVDERAAAAPDDDSASVSWGYDSGPHRFVGNLYPDRGASRVDAEAASLSRLIADYGMGEAAFLKIDCEGCEWGFLSDPELGRVAQIAGEYHGDDGRLSGLLGPTHDFHVDRSSYLFQAVRR